MVKKIQSLLVAFSLVACLSLQAQQRNTEGMWLPSNVKDLNYKDMESMGFKLGPDGVYSTTQGSLKDVIVRLNGGMCTAEIISEKGLLLSNHHCAYDGVASLSSVGSDLLTDGFWAKNFAEEIRIPDAFISMLISAENITDVMKKAAQEGEEAVEAKQAELIKKATDGKPMYSAQVKEMFAGNEIYLMVYEDFKDVRLVGVPPSAIGKFGGDTDNWMWPRHTGDFSLMRIYADKDNKPAEYSKDNVPYKPKKWLPISLKGVKQDDYAMIMGYPGSTDRYLTAKQIEFALDNTNGARYQLMDQKLKIMKKHMDKNDTIRIGLAADYASLANYWKYLEGQTTMLKRYDIAGLKRKEEANFNKWAANNEKYKGIIDNIANLHKGYDTTDKFVSYLNFGLFGPQASGIAANFMRMQMGMEANPTDTEAAKGMAGKMTPKVEEGFKSFFPKADKELMTASIVSFLKDIPKRYLPAAFSKILTSKVAKKGKTMEEKVALWVADAFKRSIATDKKRAMAFLAAPSLKVLQNDPIVDLVTSTVKDFRAKVAPRYGMFEGQMAELSKVYIAGLMEMHKDKKFYPDANSTMRATYGKVASYEPRDGVVYDYFTTLDGIIEKEDNTSDEFKVPKKLHELWEKKDYGQYALPGNVMPVCFLTTNDITGGNSGSPVINGNGELIGCAFDGNWEAMAGDIYVFPNLNRTIAVDARYILFIIDKYAGAKNIIDELEIRK
jgi:hypothetical protein